MSKYAYLEAFQSLLEFEITRVDYKSLVSLLVSRSGNEMIFYSISELMLPT